MMRCRTIRPAPGRLVLEGELSIVTRADGGEALVLDYFSAEQRELVEAVRDGMGPGDRGFGEERFGRVRVVVQPLASSSSRERARPDPPWTAGSGSAATSVG